ncbi:MAG: MBL fold metallo-hydrolase [Lawsonibacter sp.]|nr:MBL fold metallo-hydrolase [Lawsonibacter sp.]
MTCEIIQTGSKGNAVLLDGSLLLDCGVPFKLLEGCWQELKLVLLTHIHGDHFNRATLARLAKERPSLRFGCCEWLLGPLATLGIQKSRIDVYEPGTWYSYGAVMISPFAVFHDVENCGYRVKAGGESALYVTDTGSLDGVEAKGYDLYMIEANYEDEEIRQRLQSKLERGEYAYEYRAMAGHLSKEKADAWLAENAVPGSRYVYLHGHDQGALQAREEGIPDWAEGSW